MKLNTNQWIGAVFLALAALVSGTTALRGQAVQGVTVAKGQYYIQDGGVLPDGLGLKGGPFGLVELLADVHTSGAGALTGVNLRVPGTARLPFLALVPFDDDEFGTNEFFPLLEGETTPDGPMLRCNTAYPAGTYSFTNQTPGGRVVRSVALGAITPSVLPKSPFVSNWDELRELDPAEPFTLRWIQHGSGAAVDFVQVSIVDGEGNERFFSPGIGEPGMLTGASNSVVIPTNTFLPDQEYTGSVLFANLTTQTTSGGTFLVAGFFMNTQFEVTPPPPQGRIGLTATNFTIGENESSVAITLTRFGGSSGAASVELFTVNDTATHGVDYTGSPEPMIVTFADGQTTATNLFAITNDVLLEGNETFRVVLDDPDDESGADLSRAQAIVTIVDDENASTPVFNFSVTNINTVEGGPAANLTVTRSGSTSGTNSVLLSTLDGTASAMAADYRTLSRRLTFAPTVASLVFPITNLNDAIDENDEFLTVVLSEPSSGAGLGLRSMARVTILDNDTAGRFSFSAAMYATTEADTNTVLRVLVRRTGGTATQARVHVFTTDDSAVGGNDFETVEEDLVFGSNIVEMELSIPIVGNDLPEMEESFKLSLRIPEDSGGAQPGPVTNATVKILDDEISVAFKSLTYSNSEAGPVANIAVVRSGPVTAAVAVDYATTDGSAEAGKDYLGTNGTLVLPAGVPQKNFAIRIFNDAIVEENETVLLSLSNPSTNAQLVSEASNAVLTIGDNDRGGVIEFSSTNLTTTEAARLATLSVARAGGLASNVTVCLLFEDGPEAGGAVNPDDYTPTNAAGVITNKIVLEFRGGETRRLVRVPLINDHLAEGLETFRARLEEPTGGASLGARSNTVVNVRDNDLGGKINFSRAAYSVNENGTNLVVTIARTGGAASNVTVIFKSFSNATATAGIDFTAATTPIVFGPGQTSTNILAPILQDDFAEGEERFQLSLMDPMGGGMVGPLSNAVVTIVDDESSISFTNAMYMVGEATANLTINALRGGSRVNPVSVDVLITNVTASSPSDHKGTNFTLTFPANVAFRSIVIPIVNDLFDEGDEEFTVSLANPQAGVQLGTKASTTVVIKDNDAGGLSPVPPQPARADIFNPGVNGSVLALAVQTDEKVLIGGSFTSVAGQSRAGIARLHADGSLDAGFNPGAPGTVYSLHVLADGRILVGGQFSSLGGTSRFNLGRLLPDGTIDPTFDSDLGGGFFSQVYALAVQPDGRILAGGLFGLARLNTDGTLDDAFDPPIDGEVLCVALQPGGAIIAGGSFSIEEPDEDGDLLAYFDLVRFRANGFLDEDFYPDPIGGGVSGLLIQPDGRILISGDFTELQNSRATYVPRPGFARLDASGNVEGAFNPAPDGAVRTMVLQADGRILLGGDFTTIAGQPRSRLARLASNGSLDTNFDAGADAAVDALALQVDGRILVAGGFSALGGENRNLLGRLANTTPATEGLMHTGTTITWRRWETSPEFWRTSFERSTNGSDWTSLGAGTRITGGWQKTGVSLPAGSLIRARGYVAGGAGSVSGWIVEGYLGKPVLLSQPSGRTNVAGSIATFSARVGGTEPLSYFWERNGAVLTNDATTSGAGSGTLILGPLSKSHEGDIRLVVSNSLGSVTSVVARLIVRDPFILEQPAGTNVTVGQSAMFAVTAAGTPPLSYQWYREGMLLPMMEGASLNLQNLSGADAGYYAVVVGNSIGSITSSPALLTVNVVTVDPGYNPGVDGDFDVGVYAVALDGDGWALVGGDFTTLGEQTRDGLGRIDAGGSLDIHFDPGTSGGELYGVFCFGVQADGRILVGGSFSSLAGLPRENLGRLHPDGTADLTFNPGAGGEEFSRVSCVALQPDGKILVGGSFTTLVGQPRDGLGRLNPNGTLDNTFYPELSDEYQPEVSCLVVQPDGKILVGGRFTTLAGQPRFGLGRLNANGSLDPAFNPDPAETALAYVFSMALQADGKILVTSPFMPAEGQAPPVIARLNSNGSLDNSFIARTEGSIDDLALQADGRTVISSLLGGIGGQQGDYLGRLNPDGSIDGTFSPVVEGGVYSSVFAMGLQADGRLVVGGSFTTLGMQSRMHLGRLGNLGAATQAVETAGSTLRWTRGGTTPEISSASFEYSSNGMTWASLGAATRVAGGWERTGVSIPAGSTVRAQGRVVTGGVSDWLVEEFQGPPALLSQPESRTSSSGATVALTARAGGSPPLSHQWFKDGEPLTNQGHVTGATGVTLALSPVSGADGGVYHFVVSNALGSVTSAVANLTVIDPLISH